MGASFGFGYFLVLVVTQQFLIPMHLALRILLGISFVVSCGIVFGLELQYDCTECTPIGIADIWTVSWIPMLSYAMAFVIMTTMFWICYFPISCIKSQFAKSIITTIAVVVCSALCFTPYIGLFGSFSSESNSTLPFEYENMTCPDIRCINYKNFTREVPTNIGDVWTEFHS